jgi:hypothetical protein
MVSGCILLGIASYLFFFAQSFTFYTPYSLESIDWILSLPNGMDYSINSYVGLEIMLGSFFLGSILLLISIFLELKTRLFSNRDTLKSKDTTS